MAETPKPLNYADYLCVDQLLQCQKPVSGIAGSAPAAHDELLFIIVHQAYELWFRQILHELDSAIAIMNSGYVSTRDVALSVRRLERVVEIQKLLIQQFAILETMTPLDFLEFRDSLAPASGFQSYQFRMFENRLGLPEEQRLRYNECPYFKEIRPDMQNAVRATEQSPSLFRAVERWLERTPFLQMQDTFWNFSFGDSYKTAVETMLSRQDEQIAQDQRLGEEDRALQSRRVATMRTHFNALFDESLYGELLRTGQRRLSRRATLAALFISLYRDEPMLQIPFRLIVALQDMDEYLAGWRYRHSLMVHRMIGIRVGTGGSAGYDYLRSTVEKHRAFSDFVTLSSFLIPRSHLPALPEKLAAMLAFDFEKQGGNGR